MNILLSFLVAMVLSYTVPNVKKTNASFKQIKLKLQIASPNQQQDSILNKSSIYQLHQLESSCSS